LAAQAELAQEVAEQCPTLKITAWPWHLVSWLDTIHTLITVCGIYKLHITSHETGTKWPKVAVLTS